MDSARRVAVPAERVAPPVFGIAGRAAAPRFGRAAVQGSAPQFGSVAKRAAAADRVGVGRATVDWSHDATYRSWADRGVSPSVARYLAERAAKERSLTSQLQLMGGPSTTPGHGASSGLQMQNAADQRAHQQRQDRGEMVATTGLEIAGMASGIVDPQSALLMTGARLAINILDPTGGLGL